MQLSSHYENLWDLFPQQQLEAVKLLMILIFLAADHTDKAELQCTVNIIEWEREAIKVSARIDNKRFIEIHIPLFARVSILINDAKSYFMLFYICIHGWS